MQPRSLGHGGRGNKVLASQPLILLSVCSRCFSNHERPASCLPSRQAESSAQPCWKWIRQRTLVLLDHHPSHPWHPRHPRGFCGWRRPPRLQMRLKPASRDKREHHWCLVSRTLLQWAFKVAPYHTIGRDRRNKQLPLPVFRGPTTTRHDHPAASINDRLPTSRFCMSRFSVSSITSRTPRLGFA
ncbi:uncharacterized protein IWZ02DRAFT_157876 [Phyllosticta citriasiana]|uniref:uncharacterized protein n=1 Tax=Phyllosticta citriasiana TaxID=595635 RepID=UPI0030FD8E1A